MSIAGSSSTKPTIHALYQYRDDWGNEHYLNAKIGGFKNEVAAIAAISKRSNTGIVTDSSNRVLFVVRNGTKVL